LTFNNVADFFRFFSKIKLHFCSLYLQYLRIGICLFRIFLIVDTTFTYHFSEVIGVSRDYSYRSNSELRFKYITYDTYNSKGYVVAYGYALYTTTDFKSFSPVTGNFFQSGYAKGSATDTLFGNITGILTTAHNPNAFWMADESYGCIRDVNLLTGYSGEVAGQCSVMGVVDGDIVYAVIGKPLELIEYEPDIIVFYDNTNKTIRQLEIGGNPWNIYTRHTVGVEAFGLAYDIYRKDFYVMHAGGILLVNAVQKLKVFNAIQLHSPSDMYFLNKDRILIADYGNNILHLANYQGQILSTMCSGSELNQQSSDSQISVQSCELLQPKLFLKRLDGSGLYIMADHDIYELLYESEPSGEKL